MEATIIQEEYIAIMEIKWKLLFRGLGFSFYGLPVDLHHP